MQVLKRFSALALAFILILSIAYVSAEPVEADETYYTTIEEAGARLREMMKNRSSDKTIYFQAEDADAHEIATAIYKEAIRHTGVPDEGDYLMLQIECLGWQTNEKVSNGSRYITISYRIEFRTTAEQEKEVDAAVASLLQDLDIENSVEYSKIKAIYNWITSSVIYDYAHVSDPTYRPQFTAYGALMNRTAVCQGYALLLYRLALEVGVDCRIITGFAGEEHGWNIVKIGDAYYNLDSTWDASIGMNWSYFLKSQDSFWDHIRDEADDTPEFHEQYPMAEDDYVFTWMYETADGFGYSIDANGEVVIDKYLGNSTNVVIPEEIDGHSVTSIGGQAFFENNTVKSISIPSSVRKIEDGGAFTRCKNLETVSIPENAQLEYIGEWAFNDCEKLKNVTLPSSIRILALSCFEGCKALKELLLPEGVEEVGQNTYSGTSVTAIHIPSTCTFFSLVNNPSSLESITVAPGNSVYQAHEGVLYVLDQWVPDTPKDWALLLYPRAKASTEYTVPDFCSHIFGDAFIVDPGDSLFLQTLYIGDCDATSGTMGGCSLSRIRCRIVPAETNPYYKSVDGMILSKDGKTLLQVPAKLGDTIIVPDSVKTIEAYAAERGYFTKVVLPEGITHISGAAFWQHQGKFSIYLPASLTYIVPDAFQDSIPTIYYGGSYEQWTEIYFEFDINNLRITPHYYKVDVTNCYYSFVPHTMEVMEYVEPTCSSDGLQINLCTVCNTKEELVLPKLDHQYSDEGAVVAPGCVKQGCTIYVCAVCGQEHRTDYVEGTGHQYGEWYNISEVAEDGTVKQRHDCNVCGFSMTRQTTYIEEPSEPVATSSETDPQAEPVIWPYFVAAAVLSCSAVGITFVVKKRKHTAKKTES